MSRRLLIKPSAVRELESLPQAARQMLATRISELESAKSERLCAPDYFCARVPPFRILYRGDGGRVVVVKISSGGKRPVKDGSTPESIEENEG